MAKRRLFRGGTKYWWFNATLNWVPDDSLLDTYATGYLQAAQFVGRTLARKRSVRLTLAAAIYPLVFLWRHYLELRFKELVLSFSDLRDQKPPANVMQQHNLSRLWSSLRPMVRDQMTKKELALLDAVIQEFDAVDPTSQSFRYHASTKGQRSVSGVTHIGVPRLVAALSKVSDLLEGMSMAASVERDQRAEMYSDYP